MSAKVGNNGKLKEKERQIRSLEFVLNMKSFTKSELAFIDEKNLNKATQSFLNNKVTFLSNYLLIKITLSKN